MGTLFGSTTSARTGRLAALLLVPAVVVPASTTAAFAAEGDALAVTNAVSATYDVDHAWQVFNAVDRNRAAAAVGGDTASINYAVGVTALGSPARSGSEVRGALGVTNPDQQALAVDLSAELAGAGACTIAAVDESPATGLQVTLPPGASSFAYACTPGSTPADPATTTVTVAWQAPGGEQSARAAGSSSAVAQAAYVVDQRTDELTTVTNSLDGSTPVDLGTFDWDEVWAAPDHRVLVKVSALDLASGDGVCADHVNLARESADATSDTETVTVCPAAEVLGEQSFGKAVGQVRVTCQGTVRARLVNRSGRAVFYYLRVGSKMHRFVVKSLGRKTVVAQGSPLADVVLKAGSRQLERTQLPWRCQAPGVLPATGLRGTTR